MVRDYDTFRCGPWWLSYTEERGEPWFELSYSGLHMGAFNLKELLDLGHVADRALMVNGMWPMMCDETETTIGELSTEALVALKLLAYGAAYHTKFRAAIMAGID
jgi:hypothetical protein